MLHWPTDIAQQTKSLWHDGKTARYIAAELSSQGFAVTKNAVISKIHREGWAEREKGYQRRAATVRREHKRTRDRIINIKGEPIVHRALRKVVECPDFLGLSIWELKDGQCRYPRGNQAPYLFCGQPVEKVNNASSYCNYCHALTHVPYTEPIKPNKYQWR